MRRFSLPQNKFLSARLSALIFLVVLAAFALFVDAFLQKRQIPELREAPFLVSDFSGNTSFDTALPEEISEMVPWDAETIILHFWATWCPTCMAEMPELLAATETLPEGTFLVMVSLDKASPTMFYESLKNKDINHSIKWIDDEKWEVSRAVLGTIKLPVTLAYDVSSSRVFQRVDGPLEWVSFLTALEK
ncbi:MAG: hypothetical protein COY40_05215 [Alphaproteobacteria bacterium CG_4_10_14_0_8_um_filter_53_9]|nr:MAG: hypothetical protein COY40_05215 [Alphaproteobacteria bacterium CG_4_10_14_0_8_um_filter_53_9]